MELLPVVNEKNEVVGVEERETVHRKGMYHRSVFVIVVSGDGRILLQRRSEKKRICPLKWDISMAEHVRVGESYLEAAVRGLKEELGISVKEEELKRLRKAHLEVDEFEELGIKDCEFVEVYYLRYCGRVKINKEEVCKVGFFSKEEVEKMYREGMLTPWFMRHWKYLRRIL